MDANFEEKNWHQKNVGNFLSKNYETLFLQLNIFSYFFILEKLVFENIFV